ncbi:MAG TPA: alkaline phosphatase PhoX [Myxococcota bacterium]|jgi:secreted PhoX family phosphatase|nr:alkaline phosphatase PhoX [Myxococcota bacterium]
MRRIGSIAALAGVGLAASGFALGAFDFGLQRDFLMKIQSFALFGVIAPVDASSTASIDAATANANPAALATVAKGLKVRVVTAAANAGANIDMMALWPDDIQPTHLIACNEQDTTNPGVQRIRLSDGLVETIVTGTTECDPLHRTPWGTIVFGEEDGSDGRVYELIHPLETTGVSLDRTTGVFSGGVGAENLTARPALGRLSFEGIAIYPSGVVYYGDENRPSKGTPGGAYFKFVPATPFTGNAPITDLTQSPLAAGQVFGLRLGKRSGNTDYGQGTNTGRGTWVAAASSSFFPDLRAVAGDLKLTGYYRPEDAAIDLSAEAQGQVRFCANNTGNEGDDRAFGETLCITDGTLDEALANTATPEVQLLVVGTPELAMMDNIDNQPGRGNWVLHEDGDAPALFGRNNDLWDCLDDGHDDDLLSDGCIRVATLNDLNAEWTGGLFDGLGRRFFVSVQHNVTGHGVVLEISGWR